jgi:sulfoxide reductase catalytic subunit YedY
MKKLSKKTIFLVVTALIAVTLLLPGLAGCKSAATAVTAGNPWTLTLEGVRTENIDEPAFAEGATPDCHGVKWTDAQGNLWEGIPLWLLVGRVDNPKIEHGAGAFDDALADKGYEVQVIGPGNQIVTLTSSEVKRNDNIIIAYRLNGQPLPDKQWPLELVGSAVTPQNQIGMITAIKLNLPALVASTPPNQAGGQITSPPPASSSPTSTPTETTPPASTQPTPIPAETTPPLSDTPSDELIGLVHSEPANVDNSGLPVTPVGQLHITGTAPDVDISQYRLTISGLVDNPLTLTYDDILSYPATTQTVLLICPEFFVDNASWTGVPLTTLLAAAQMRAQAQELTFWTVDGYSVSISLEQAQNDGSFLAYEVDGQTLPKEHGYPLRLVLKGMYGSNWVKWVDRIEVK